MFAKMSLLIIKDVSMLQIICLIANIAQVIISVYSVKPCYYYQTVKDVFKIVLMIQVFF